jgi:S1-C subfamily serine protease
MKHIGITALVLASTVAHAAAPLTPDKIAERAIPSIVLIKTASGHGTGFVVAPDGRIATNLHVIGDAQQATVVLADGRELRDIEVLGVDDDHDLMVLRVPARNLRPLTLGDSTKVKPGERVVAIGHPLGLGNTVSDGLVSAVRKINPQLTVLQISAPISPGSSGGPLFNDRGEVIGVSTLIITQGQNLNFGMPVDQLKPMLRAAKGTPLAKWKPPAGKHGRQVPTHELALLDDCAPDRRQEIQTAINDAIEIGAPLYNQGNHEACYRIYAAAALDVNRKLPACPGPKRALLDGVKRADSLGSWTDKAWAMRDAFDGVLDVLKRAHDAGTTAASGGGARRKVPHHPLAMLDGCTHDNLKYIGNAILGAINVGAPLYNQGNIEACYRVYEGAILDVSRNVPACGGPNKALQAGLKEAGVRTAYADKAWALRDAFDGVLDVLSRRGIVKTETGMSSR